MNRKKPQKKIRPTCAWSTSTAASWTCPKSCRRSRSTANWPTSCARSCANSNRPTTTPPLRRRRRRRRPPPPPRQRSFLFVLGLRASVGLVIDVFFVLIGGSDRSQLKSSYRQSWSPLAMSAPGDGDAAAAKDLLPAAILERSEAYRRVAALARRTGEFSIQFGINLATEST